ncbi:PRC-barrel domain-containing protein [Xinfangfangia sp. CPCC 101601]|uniref:PRC-barrel domain-containing protein n=1 Tax=Pseudogemmobacter lacusdianii TaxID=3069608 RepID=A0ABU0VUR8_9RHOB|nr:PRC-barrel domain-containing protein [Xinfangfangia sp. CPCC 101601]MDQ2065484.1 PRC-barrel domain-containing protein [Xinfangfangia sp. CPCC 101601]
MRKYTVSAIALTGVMALGLPAFAQEATPAPAAPAVEATEAPVTTEAPATTAPAATAGDPAVTIVAPEGYSMADFATVTADQLKGVNLYDAEGNDVAEIADVVIGADNKVTGIITDVGGFLGMGEHRVSLNPDQVHIYKNTDGDMRAYVPMTKDALKALPAYVAP